jgi:hypothetical protein
MVHKAVINRFEEDWAVVMLDGQPEPIHLHRNDLPRAARAGDHLQIELNNGRVTSVYVDEAANQEVLARIQAKIERLRRGDHLKDSE